MKWAQFQHQGFGTLLMEEAERIARDEHGSKKLAVISGVGVRSYYARLGYQCVFCSPPSLSGHEVRCELTLRRQPRGPIHGRKPARVSPLTSTIANPMISTETAVDVGMQ